MSKGEYKLCFQTFERKITMTEFSNYFYLFRATYALCCEYIDEHNYKLEDILVLGDSIHEDIRSKMGKARASYNYFKKDLGENEIFLTKIHHESPFNFYVVAWITALVLAVILSGGKVKIKEYEFQLNPLGDGIKKLREAFKRKGIR